jgi:hypothetical protein
MNHTKIVTFGLIASAIIIVLPTIFICDTKEAFALGASILSGLSGVGAIIFAAIIYDDLGLGKRMFDKQVDIVIELLEEIKNIRFQASYYSDGNIKSFMMFSIEKKLNSGYYNYDIDGKMTGDLKICFPPENYYNGCAKIIRLKSSVWIPVELVKHLDILSGKSMIQIDEVDSHDRILIAFRNVPATSDDKLWMQFVDSDMTLTEYVMALQDLAAQLEIWLSKHSKGRIKELNI